MAYMITHSLLSSWLYSMKDNPYADASQEDTSKEDFLRVLRREPTPTTEAMQNGIDFENLVTDILSGKEVFTMEVHEEPNSGEIIESKVFPRWYGAACEVAGMIKGAQLQHVASKNITVHGMDIYLYGRLDALKAGKIFDIKFSKTYDRGKYVSSTQHPTYFEIVPEAYLFTYIVSDGNEVWTERYRADETPSIVKTIDEFLNWLELTGNMDTYKKYWKARE